jgi:hypothetical protein
MVGYAADNVSDPNGIDSTVKDKVLNKAIKKIVTSSVHDPKILYCQRTVSYLVEVELQLKEKLLSDSDEQGKEKAARWFPKFS